MPIGTDTMKTARQCTTARNPPTSNPMNDPAMAATWLMPSAMPRRCAGNASVMIAVELAKSIAPPTPCTMRNPMSHSAAGPPVPGTSDSAIDPSVNTTNPRL